MKGLHFKALGVISLFFIVMSLLGQQEHEHEQQQTDKHRNRWHWQMPVRVMDEIGVKEGMTVADVGAGDGYFTFHLAERVGNSGKILACDIDNRALQVIRDRCAEKGIQNISVILGKEDDPLIPQKSADIILMVNVIHLIENTSGYLKKLQHNLKPDGSLVIVQWDAEKMDSESKGWDPDDRAKYTLRANLRHIYDGEFEVVQIKDFLPMQLIYICQPATHK
ncbi:MAG: class I SAM-dependent methyltransferase [Candidatus Aminicenantes bacterium]|nr:MAG: class I SAM-dependent methyltransferase [Candidatus Aminicenantes bacterium]